MRGTVVITKGIAGAEEVDESRHESCGNKNWKSVNIKIEENISYALSANAGKKSARWQLLTKAASAKNAVTIDALKLLISITSTQLKKILVFPVKVIPGAGSEFKKSWIDV